MQKYYLLLVFDIVSSGNQNDSSFYVSKVPTLIYCFICVISNLTFIIGNVN